MCIRDSFTLEHNSVPMTATEDVVLGSIAITKHTDQPAIPEPCLLYTSRCV